MVLDQVVRIVKVPPDVGVGDAFAGPNEYQRHQDQGEHHVKRKSREQALAPAGRRARYLVFRFPRADWFQDGRSFNCAHRLYSSLVGSLVVYTDTFPPIIKSN